jgi:putative ABC transport system substrate-binding protein
VLVTHTTPGAIAAKHATSSVPIVAATMSDPIRSGLVMSLARPGGNLTGLSLGFDKALAGKWLELLQEMVPRLSTVAVLQSADNSIARDLARELESVAPARGLKLRLIEIRGTGTLDHAFDVAARKAQALVVVPDPIIYAARREQVTALAAKYRLPTIYYLRDFADAGGLIAYAPDFGAVFRRAADYVDKILRGAHPGDLPVEQPTQFVLVVNLKTATVLGIPIPESILQRSDQVIR